MTRKPKKAVERLAPVADEILDPSSDVILT